MAGPAAKMSSTVSAGAMGNTSCFI